MKRIVIVGGGYAGFYTALGLERKLMRSDEAEVILINPRPYMTYQPFLPEVLAGSIEPRHALVSLRKNLPRPRVISGSVVKISHADKSVVVCPHVGNDYALSYDVIVATAGAVTRTFPVAGLMHVHLNTYVVSAVNGHVVLSTGEQINTNIIIWAAGNSANPVNAKHTDLPVDSQGFLVVRADLRVGTEDLLNEDAWGAGDDASVPDLSGDSPTGRVVPNAQNAVRQGRVLAANVVASLRCRPTRQYIHRNLGTIATLGMGRGAFQSARIGFTGFLAWLIHRPYHLYAVPTWEQKARVLAGWLVSVRFGRDIVSIENVHHPRAAFVRGGFPRSATDRADRRFSSEIGQPHQGAQEIYLKQKVDSLAT